MEDDYKKWLTQLRKGYVELCILLCIDKHSQLNGAKLIHILKDVKLIVTEGTLYPLLNRMEQNNLLVSSWQMPNKIGHPKKEYKMTNKAKVLLPKFIDTYKQYYSSLETLKEKD